MPKSNESKEDAHELTTIDSTSSDAVENPQLFDYKVYKRCFTDSEWLVISNNMKKPIKISVDENENNMAKFVRAQNRIIRIAHGTEYTTRILKKKLDLPNKVACCFFYFDKFGMKRSYRLLWARMFVHDMNICIYGLPEAGEEASDSEDALVVY